MTRQPDYMAGLEVIIKFVGIYAARELGMPLSDLMVMFIIVQLSAAAGALAFGYLDSIFGAKNTVLLTLAWWTVGVLSIYFLDPLCGLVGISRQAGFFSVSLVMGTAIGATQSSSRAVVGLLTPASRSAQMFGFWVTFSRIASLLAMSYGFLADAIGLRSSLLLVVSFFVAGGILLAGIPIRKGIEEAQLERGDP